MPGQADPSEGEMYQTVSDAFGSMAKASGDRIKQTK